MKKITALLAALMIVLCFTGCGKDTGKTASSPEETEAPSDDGSSSGLEEVKEVVFDEVKEPEETESEKLEKKINGFSLQIAFGNEIETIGPEDVRKYITVENDKVASVDEEAVREYVNSLSKKYDTFGITRQFKKHDGSTVAVTGGDFGWWMDRVTTASELTERIKALEGGDFEPVYFGTGLGFKTAGSDIGNTYVEIDLDAQHLYVYRDSTVVEESDFVSGGLLKGNGTPVGTYGITYKERDATLVGENYSSSVSFWMPFNGNVGMHDASWRKEFGGHIYYMNGSHGCINLPKSKAESIYGIVEKGEPVVVYGTVTKEQAIAGLSDEEKLVAIQKGYISMTDEVALLLLQQQQALSAQMAAQGQQPENPAPGQPADQAPQQNPEQNAQQGQEQAPAQNPEQSAQQ